MASAGPALAQTAPAAERTLGAPYADHIAEASRRFGVPVAWIRAVLAAESAGDAHAVSPKGAMGLMQLMPETWGGLRSRYGLGRDPFDPRDNILAGVAYLREMHDRYGSPGFLAAYNAGPARYEDYLGGRPLPAETRAYLATLLPVIGGELPAPLSVVAAADPFAWRGAPLFVELSERTAAAPRPQSDGAATGPAGRGQPDLAPQPTGLFVAGSLARGPQ